MLFPTGFLNVRCQDHSELKFRPGQAHKDAPTGRQPMPYSHELT